MAYHFNGKAIFSTHNGEYARRERIPSMRIVLRSNPIQDQQTMVARLRQDFPEVCKAITSPVTDSDIYEYFDYCDAAVQGFEFLRAVLEYIAALNASTIAEHAEKVRDYVGRWQETNTEAFILITPQHTVTDLFTVGDIEAHGVDFLAEAMVQIKRLRAQEDENARQSAIRLQMQHAHMMQNQRSFTQSQAPARPHFPVDLPSAQGARAVSNPEQGQPHQQEGSIRHLPVPPGQFSAPQGRIPLQRLTASAELLEHVHPGSTSRGDFHSDPTAHSDMGTYKFGPPNNYVAIPSQGVPGPFNYRPVPLPTQPVLLLNRQGTFGGNIPKGKKNPKKKSSDDARTAPGTGNSTENGLCQPSNGGVSTQGFVSQNMQMPFYPRSSLLIREVHPSLGTVLHSGNDHHPNLPPNQPLGDGREPFHPPASHVQTYSQLATKSHHRERAGPNPSWPSAVELQGSTQDPPPIAPFLPTSTSAQHQIVTATGTNLEENASFVPTLVQPHISQPLDPHAFGHQIPDRRINLQHQNQNSELQRAVLAPMSNSGQSKFPGTLRHRRANEIARHPTQDGCKIWIGGIPKGFDKANIMDLLRPCRGLVGVSEPRAPKQSPAYKIPVVTLFAFADFENPIDAAEAMERIPQTRFAGLPKGSFLKANYPLLKANLVPGYHQHRVYNVPKWPIPNISPTACKGEDILRESLKTSENEIERLWARGGKQSTSNSEGSLGKPSEHAGAEGPDPMESSLQLEEAIACPFANDKAQPAAYVSLPCTDRSESMPVSQGSAAIQPGVDVETNTTQVPSIPSDGTQDTSSVPNPKLQIHDNHQATSTRHTEGRTKASKKKSKGSNKLSAPEEPRSEALAVHSTPRKTNRTNRMNRKAQTKPSVDESFTSLEGSGQKEEQGKPAVSEIEAGTMIALPVPPEPTSTVPNDPITADQSFLGCNPTGDLKQPEAPVADVTNTSDGKSDKLEVSETGFGQLKDKLGTSIMRSTAAQSGIVVISKPASEADDQLWEDKSGRSPVVQDSEPGETGMEQGFENATSLAHFEMGDGKKRFQINLQNPTEGESGDLQAKMIEKNPENLISPLLIRSSPSEYDQNRLKLETPARKRALSIPPRSSSLVAPPTPIKTHQKKKKPRNLTPVKAAFPARVIGLSIEDVKMNSSLQQMGNVRLKLPVLTIDTAARHLTAASLPKPETPFLTDDGVRVAPPKINRHFGETSNAEQYYAQKNNYQWGNGTQINVTLDGLESAVASKQPLETRTLSHVSVDWLKDLETTLREAGYRCLSGTSPFTIKDPELAFLEKLDEEGKPLEDRTKKENSLLTLLDDKGKASLVSFDAWAKQQEMVDVVRKATAVKRLLAGSPPLPWIKIESLQKQISRFVTHSSSEAYKQQIMKTKSQQILKAKALLDTIPQRDSSISEVKKWSRKASLFMEENGSEPSTALVEPRTSTTNSPSKSPRGVCSRRQQPERRHLVLINQPNPQTWSHKFEKIEDAFPTANAELNDSLTSGQTTESEPSPSTYGRRTPSEEGSISSVAPVSPTALTQVTKLKDLFPAMGEDCRRRSEDRQWSTIPPEGGRTTASAPELRYLGGESDTCRLTEIEDELPEPEIKEAENEAPWSPQTNKPDETKKEALGSDEAKQDQKLTMKSDISKDPTSTKMEDEAPRKLKDPTHQRQNSQLLDVSFSSFDSNDTASNEGASKEPKRPRGGHSPIKRSGYNAVAGRGIDGGRGGKKEESRGKDPWALPQGEKPWGSEGVGRGEKRKRRAQ